MTQKLEITEKVDIFPGREKRNKKKKICLLPLKMWLPKSLKSEIILCTAFLFLQNEACALNCRTGTQRFVKLLRFTSLFGWCLKSIGHGILCGVAKLTFASMEKFTPTAVEFRQGYTFMLFKNNPCIQNNDSVVWFYGHLHHWIVHF